MMFQTVLSLSKWTPEIQIVQNILQTAADIIQTVYCVNEAPVTCQISTVIVRSASTVF
jgi:hypothetical protein